MKKLKQMFNDICNWMYWYSPIYIHLCNLYKEYNIAKKYFNKPILKFYCSSNFYNADYFGFNYNTNNYILHVFCHELRWKYKNNEPRFESVPYLQVTLFNKYNIVIGLEVPDILSKGMNNMIYWETILWYNYFTDRNIVEAYENNIWLNQDKSQITPKCFLTNLGKSIIENVG